MIRHEVINNSIFRHHSNNFNSLSEDKPVAILKRHRSIIGAIVYCLRTGTEDIFAKLNSSGITTLTIVELLISKREAKDKCLPKHIMAVH